MKERERMFESLEAVAEYLQVKVRQVNNLRRDGKLTLRKVYLATTKSLKAIEEGRSSERSKD